MRYVVVLGLLLTLSGCGPSTVDVDAAWERCVDGPLELWHLKHPDATPDQYADEAIAAAERCQEQRETLGDAQFVELWGA